MAYTRFLFGESWPGRSVIFPLPDGCVPLIGWKKKFVVLRLNEYQPVFYSPFTPLKGNLDGFEFWLNSIVSSGPQ
jgi:hypothetical protein